MQIHWLHLKCSPNIFLFSKNLYMYLHLIFLFGSYLTGLKGKQYANQCFILALIGVLLLYDFELKFLTSPSS